VDALARSWVADDEEHDIGMVFSKFQDNVQARERYKAAVAKSKQLEDAMELYSKEIASFERTETILTLLLENAAEKDQLEMSLQNAKTTAQLAHDQHTAMLLQMETRDHNPGDLAEALEVAHEATVAANDVLGQLAQESAEVSKAYETIMAEWAELV
jgi:hypothetical protein